MKKTFSFCMLLLLSMPASAWVFFSYAQEKATGILLPKIINQQGQNLRVCMDVLDENDKSMYNSPADRTLALEHYNQTKPFIASAYQTWFDTLRSTIINSGRQKEFADVLALLPSQPLSFNFINPDATPCYDDSKQDLYIRLDLAPVEGHQAYIRVHNNFAAMTLFQKEYKIPERLKRIILHEAGHTLGLGDMYSQKEGADYNSSLYSMANIQKLSSIPSCMNENCSGNMERRIVIKTYERLGEEGSRRSSQEEVMLFHPYSNELLTCDDMDGLVNLLDFYFPSKMSNRRSQGWLSFCKDKNVAYVASLPVPVSAEEKASFDSFAASGRQGISPLADKAANALAQTARLETARKERARQESLAAQEKEKQAAQEALQTALAAEKKQQQYNALLQSTPQVPNECPICRKPLRNGTKIGIVCDRAEDGSIRGCIAKHSACGAGWTKSQLREFLKNTDPKFVKSTNRIQIADTSLPSWASE